MHIFFIISGAKAQEKNQMAVLRMLANLFATKHGEELMIKNFEWVTIATCCRALLVEHTCTFAVD